MNNARVERMIREVKAEPAAQFFDRLVTLVERLWPKVNTGTAAKLSLQ
ncbi:MAG: hypothetical protein ACXWAC_01445 [Usitatibacter sp.]